jgi:hypothetical protein
MNSDITGSYTEEEFIKSFDAQTAQVGDVLSISRGTVSDPHQTALASLWTVTVQYVTERRAPSGTTMMQRYEAFFIWQAGGWKVWFTVER